MMAQRRQSLTVNILFSVAVSVGLMGLLEGACQFFERDQPPVVAAQTWHWARAWGGDFSPIRTDATGWPPEAEYNHEGMRDRWHTREKPERTWRLVCLGDSVTFGAGVAAGQSFPQTLQRRLSRSGRRIEVFNMARKGWSTRQERQAYELVVRPYRPDQVVLGVCLNDIVALQKDLRPPPRWLTHLYARSALVRRVINAEGREIGRVEDLFTQHESAKVREAFEEFFAEIRLLQEAARQDGATLHLLILPFRFQVVRDAPAPPAPIVQRRILAFCREEGLACLDLLPALAPAGPEAFVDHDHLSPLGARRVAAAVAESGWLPSGFSDREIVARLVSETGLSTPTLALLEHALESDGAETRGAGAWALARLPGFERERVGVLVRALQRDPSAGVRMAAALALRRMRDTAPGARPALFGALDDRSESVRHAAATALSVVPPVAQRDLASLRKALANDDAYVRAFAAWSLGRLGPAAAPAVPELIHAVRAGDPTHATMERALREIGAAKGSITAQLKAGLGSENVRERAGAARAIGRLRLAAPDVVPTLDDLLSDDDAVVRAEAARALGRLGASARPAIPGLIRAVSDEDARVRLMAIRAIRLVPADEEARAAVTRARRDPDPMVEREARLTLHWFAGRRVALPPVDDDALGAESRETSSGH